MSDEPPEGFVRADLDEGQLEALQRIEAATVRSTSSARRRLIALADRWDLEGKTQEAAELRAALGVQL